MNAYTFTPCFVLFLLLCGGWPGAVFAQTDLPDMTMDLEEEEQMKLKQGALLSFQFIKPDEEPSFQDLQPTDNSQVHYLKGERGVHEKRDLLLRLSYDTSATFNPSDRVDEEISADYVIIETGKPIQDNWLKPGTIFGFHHILLKPEVDREEFEEFIHEIWSPTRSDALPDSKLIFLKAVSGAREGEYGYIWLIDSEETRDFYFPESEVPSKMYTEFEKGWNWINDDENLGRFLAGPEDQEFTDYLVIK
ncbi:hypothetical protein GGR26_001828 [Lewinella marina]|uniref:Uncharacterized protein n=1 Tax=Neolewinella marina TaxID=438751 RepID=A0A2G0CDB8_9BACT|nr:hypothetical protein [Neolewinella marina]NJB86060.1 hypothetical protein [Neolewinella marina]PHK97976.1 hypothetical protein CGL56_12335 [Neolewinella marina]